MNLTPEKKKTIKSALIYSLINIGMAGLFLGLCIWVDSKDSIFGFITTVSLMLENIFIETVSNIGALFFGLVILFGYVPSSIVLLFIWASRLKHTDCKGLFIGITYSITVILAAIIAVIVGCTLTINYVYPLSISFFVFEYIALFFVYTIFSLISGINSLVRYLLKSRIKNQVEATDEIST